MPFPKSSFPKTEGKWLGKDCSFHDPETEMNCHYSMFVSRKCREGCCPDLDQYCSGFEIMHGRLLHAATSGEKGEWEDRDVQSSAPKARID